MDKFVVVVEVVDRPQSQQVLSTRWVSKHRLDGSYQVSLVARGEQTVSSDADLRAGTPKLALHQSLMPSEAEPVYAEPAPRTHRCRVTW